MVESIRKFKFEREGNQWFVILPEWTGAKSELEMVMGADTMLDILAQGENEVYITISEEPITDSKFMLTYLEGLEGGGLYKLTSELYTFEVWLCHVVKFIYGYIPTTLYIR